MKKKIVFLLSLLILCLYNNVYAKEYKLHATRKFYDELSDVSIYGEDKLYLIIYYDIVFDEDGYITYYKETDDYGKKEKVIASEYNITKINDNERKMDYKVYDSEEEKYSNYSKYYIFNNDSWELNENNQRKTKYLLANKEIIYLKRDKVETQFTYQDNQVIIYYSYYDHLFKFKDGYFYEYEDTALSKSDNEYSQFDAFGTIEKKQNKYVITYHYDDMSYICEINTNYNFISWKASAFNMLFNIPTIMVIPYTLGFGNGSEFQEGVDYSGETKEVKKNDETLDVVKPVILHSSIIIIIVVVFIIILLMLFIFLFFKKRKR
jgi:hypothetical protein